MISVCDLVVLMDEENEELEEEELDIEGDLVEHDSSPWEIYADNDPDCDMDDTTEDTALLRSQAAKTEIIVTPISPVSKYSGLSLLRCKN